MSGRGRRTLPLLKIYGATTHQLDDNDSVSEDDDLDEEEDELATEAVTKGPVRAPVGKPKRV